MSPPTPARSPRVLLVLAGTVAAQPHSGAHLRRHHTILASGEVGGTSIVVLARVSPEERDEMAAKYGVPVLCPPPSVFETSRVRRMVGHALDRHRPTTTRWRTKELADWIAPYAAAADVVLVELLSDYAALAGRVDRPMIVDLDDLEEQGSSQAIVRLRAGLAEGLADGWTDRWRRLPEIVRSAGQIVVELERRRRWRAAGARCTAGAAAVLVSSEDDRLVLGGGANVVVVANGYESPRGPVGCDEPRSPATVVFVAEFGYEPNRVGAAWYVERVLPLLERTQPTIRTVLVGPNGERVDLGDRPAVSATGWVDDPVDVLAEADIVIVPLLGGAGTRIKILEAWAQGLPIVSTSIGAHGLHVEDEVDVLLADSPSAFAAAVYRLSRDVELRRRLREHGLARSRGLTWRQSRAALAQVLAGCVESTGR